MIASAILLVSIMVLSSLVTAQSSNFITGCNVYAPLAANSTVQACLSCLPTYVLVDNFTCNACPPGCRTCNASNICSQCSDGNYLFQGSCLSCGVGCQTCDAQGQCSQCITGYSLAANNQCFQCIANCDSCSSDGVCSACAGGYIISNNTQNQTQCIWSPGGVDATPGIITWLVVLFIILAFPFILLCYLFFRPSYHTGEAGTAYIPMNQKMPIVQAPPVAAPPVVQAPAPVTGFAPQPFATGVANPYGFPGAGGVPPRRPGF